VWLTRLVLPGPSKDFSEPVPFVTKEDLKVLAREGERDGVLSPRESLMIHRVIELSGKRARDIMTPAADMSVVRADTTLRAFFDTARAEGFTRMPVYDPDTQRYTGIVNLFYVLLNRPDDETRRVGDFTRPPLFVADDTPVDDILPTLRRFRQPMGLVRDDAGSVIGVLTTEDILEEIVGQL